MFSSENFDVCNKICTLILLCFLSSAFFSFSAWYFNFEYFRFILLSLLLIGIFVALDFIYTVQLTLNNNQKLYHPQPKNTNGYY